MKLIFTLPKSGNFVAEELLAKQHFLCDYCNQELVLSDPKVYIAYHGPISSLPHQIKEQRQFSFIVDNAIEVGKKFVTETNFLYVLAHRGLCAKKSIRRNEIINSLSNNRDSKQYIDSILVDNTLIDDINQLWEDNILLELPYIIWTNNFVYFTYSDDGVIKLGFVPRNPNVVELNLEDNRRYDTFQDNLL